MDCGGKLSWTKALKTDLTQSSISEADLMVDQEKNHETDNDAWNHLVLACTKMSAFNLITISTVNENTVKRLGKCLMQNGSIVMLTYL
jgi:hypothetical protein